MHKQPIDCSSSCACLLETEWRKRKASRRGAEEEEEEEDDDSEEEIKAMRERQKEELSKVAYSPIPTPPATHTPVSLGANILFP